MSKLQHYILLVYSAAIILISVYVPYIAQKSVYVGQSILTETVTGNYALLWDLPNSFELAAMELDWYQLKIECIAATGIAILALYFTRSRHKNSSESF
jgi:hypothetical protein